MRYLDKEITRKIVAGLAIFWFLYLSKLYFVDNAIGARLATLLAWLYALFVPIVFALLDRLYEIESPISKVTKKHRRIEEPKKLIDKLRMMHPKKFEDFVKLLFELRGYKIIYKSFWKKIRWFWIPRKDWWIDLIALKDWQKTYIQIKQYISKCVSVSDVREFYGAVVNNLRSSDKVMFITTSIFSSDAKQYAKKCGIKLIPYDKIEKVVGLIKDVEKKQKIKDFFSKIIYYRNKYNRNMRACPKCRAPLTKRGNFYWCLNYSNIICDYTEKI